MNLDNITPQGYILAMIIRDDGERILLGDGAYVFKDSQQHFQPNTFANDVVELQGTDGQLLAGQVRRTAIQTFAGYIGDASTSQQRVEQYRKQFLMFFRKKFHYTAVYIFHDGSAIQRKRGYIATAPAVPELYQRFPEWSVGLNFEDPNYYEYAEDDEGNEIYAHAVQIAISNAVSGGLIWDNNGATSDELGYTGTLIDGNGKNFQLTNTSDKILKSAELLGDAEQTTYSGKNLANYLDAVPATNNTTLTFVDDGFRQVTTSTGYGTKLEIAGLATSTTYTISWSLAVTSGTANKVVRVFEGTSQSVAYGTYNQVPTGAGHLTFTTGASATSVNIWFYNGVPSAGDTTWTKIMLESGNQPTAYEPYVGGTASPNPDYPQAVNVVTGEQTVKIEGKNLATSATTTGTNTIQVNLIKRNYQSGNYAVSIIGDVTVSNIIVSIRDHYTNIKADAARIDLVQGQQTSAVFSLSESEALALSQSSDPNITMYKVGSGHTVGITLNVQLELGSTATTYEPYQGQEFPIDLGSIELAKIGTYQDRIYKNDGKWYIEKQTGKVVLVGTETNWASANNGFLIAYTQSSPFYGIALGDPSYQSLCDHFTVQPDGTTWTGRGKCGFNSGGAFWLMHTDTAITTVADFKTWLASNPTTVYYALATPTTTEITNQALIDQLNSLQHANTYTDLTNFSTSSVNLNGFLSVKAYPKGGTPTGGYIWEAGGAGGPTTLTVDGVDNAYPIWTVPGPATNPTLTNITTGQTISWTGTVPNGQELVIDMANQTASLSGANVFEFVSGSWLTLEPGNNRISYSAINATDPSKLEWNGVTG